MLVTLKEIMKIAGEKNIAVGAFNTPNLASLHAILGAAEELCQPVILMHAQVHEEMGLCTMEEIAPIAAFGAGAISKWLYPAARRIERAPNVKNIEQYIARVDEMAQRKRELWS